MSLKEFEVQFFGQTDGKFFLWFVFIYSFDFGRSAIIFYGELKSRMVHHPEVLLEQEHTGEFKCVFLSSGIL